MWVPPSEFTQGDTPAGPLAGPREHDPPATQASTPATQALGAVRLFTMEGPLIKVARPSTLETIQGEGIINTKK